MRSLLLAAIMLLPLAAHGQTVMLPAVPQPSGPNDVEGLQMQISTTNGAPATYYTIGMTFLDGAVQTGAPLEYEVGATGVLRPVQLDEKTHWPDGSVRTAVVTFQAPPYKPSTHTAGYMIERGGTAGGTPVSLAAFAPGSATVDVVTGSKTYHLDVAQLLAGQTPSYWLQGPLATEARVDSGVLEGAFHVGIDARAYADGSSQIDVQFDNDLALNNGGNETYTATIKLGGQTFAQTINGQVPFTDWHRVVYSSGAAPAGNLVHDVGVLQSAGMVPTYPVASGVQQSEIDGEVAANSCAPLAPCGITPYMAGTGGRADIGLVPRWDAVWLLTQTPVTAAYALAQADAAGSEPWHVEQAPGLPIEVSKTVTFWADDRCAGNGYAPCSPMSFSAAYNQSGDGVPMTPEDAHEPALGYVAYLLTGSRYYLDEQRAEAGWAMTSAYTYVRQQGGYYDALFGAQGQLRAGAWGLREMWLSAQTEPDGSQFGAYAAQAVADNAAYVATLASNPAKGQLAGWIDSYYDRGNDGEFAPWQEDYAALTLEWMVQGGSTAAATALGAISPFLTGRFNQPPSVFSPFDGGDYDLLVGAGSAPGSFFTTWGQAYQATVAAGQSNGADGAPTYGAWVCEDYDTAAQSVIDGLPASAAQQQAKAWVDANIPPPGANKPPCRNPAWLLNGNQ